MDAHETQVHHNNSHDNGANGILVESDDNVINTNNLHRNGEDGIHLTVEASDNVLANNNAHHNDEWGFEDKGTDNIFDQSPPKKNKSKHNGPGGNVIP